MTTCGSASFVTALGWVFREACVKNTLGFALVCGLVLAACSDAHISMEPGRDASTDATASDSGVSVGDGAVADAAPTDAAPTDAASSDAAPSDAAVADGSSDAQISPDGGAGANCGGFAGIACADGYLCGYTAGECNVADALGTCYAPPESCAAIYRPVCGCDGETYSNACRAAMAGAQVARDGACDACPPQDAAGEGECERFFGYALGNIGCFGVSGCSCVGDDCDALFETIEECETYGESCGDPPGAGAGELCGGFAGIACEAGLDCVPDVGMCRVADASGTCQEVTDSCYAILRPVCGCDGRSYPNDCYATRAGVGIDHPGSCLECGTAQEVEGFGDCRAIAGYAYNGRSCEAIQCECVGADCAVIFESMDDCQAFADSCRL